MVSLLNSKHKTKGVACGLQIEAVCAAASELTELPRQAYHSKGGRRDFRPILQSEQNVYVYTCVRMCLCVHALYMCVHIA